MPISNITRTNTVDEWRIQTNLSANALNKIETGNYDKTAGFLNIACTAVLSITSSGTGLSVANNALVSGDFTVGKSIALGSEGAATGNLTVGANTFIYGKGAALFVANSAIVNVSIQATQSIRTNNFIANTDASITGTAQIGYLTVNNSTSIGTTLAVTGNTTVGNLVTANSVVGDNGRFSSNLVASHFVTVSGSLVADSARITSNATFGETTATTISATNARISGNANVAHVTATGSLVADSARIAANATFGETTATTINATNARISGNANVAHVTATGSLVADNARITANATFGETTATTINSTNARISGNANVAHVTASSSVVADSLRITTDAGIGGTLRVTGNSVFGNVNTANMMYAGSLRTVGRADVGGAFTVGSDASIGGKLTVSGDFILSGDIVYDTDVLVISTVTPVTTTGAAYFGVFRGNTTGGITGHNGLANSDANAYIRWAASSNTWQIRDVFNADVGTSYSKILTANLISSSLTSTSTDTFLSSSGAKSLKDSIDTEITDRQANVGSARIAVTNTYEANIGAARIADVASGQANVGAGLISVTNAYQANVGAGRIADIASAQANTGAARLELQANTGALRIHSDSTFLKLSAPGNIQTVTSDVSVTGNLTVTGTTTYLNTTELNVSDNEIVLNSDWLTTAVPTQNAGITIHRGVHVNAFIRYDETNDYWVLRDNVGQFIIATTANVGAGLITATNAGQANVGAGLISAKSTSEANVGAGIISANTNMKNYVDTRTTANISEVTNLYYTDARARAAVGVAATFGAPLSYISANGAFQHLNSGVTATTYGDSVNIPVFAVNATGHVTSATNTSIRSATTGVTGIVQLTDSISSTSTTTASVPAAVKVAYDYAQAAFNGANTVTTGTSANVQFFSIGVGTAPSNSLGEIRATGDVTAGYSDDKLKTRLGKIENALEKVSLISGFYYEPNQTAQDLGFAVKKEVGVSAQEVQAVFPEVVVPAPVDNQYLTVHYEKLIPLLVEAIKELKAEIDELKKK